MNQLMEYLDKSRAFRRHLLPQDAMDTLRWIASFN
jgi:hypothetical protein